MTITIEVGGTRFEGFTTVNVQRSMETISGSFSFAATSDNVQDFPIKRGQACKVFVGGVQVVDGFIDTIRVDYNATSHSLQIEGRDKTSDVIDSSLIGTKEFIAPITLAQVIKRALAENGLSSIGVIDQAGATEPFKEGEFVSSSVGQTVFDFIDAYARKRQVLLTTDGLGNIVLARTSNEVISTTLKNSDNGSDNNILSGSLELTDTNRFNSYTVKSQQNPSALAFSGEIGNDKVVNNNGVATDGQIRSTRQIEIISRTSDADADLEQIAIWQANIRRARSRVQSVTVQGFFADSSQSVIWEPNKLVKLEDTFADQNATLLIKSVSYNLSVQAGSTTTLTLVEPDAFSIQAKINQSESRANNNAGNLEFS